MTRNDLPKLLFRRAFGLVGIELGVARGDYSDVLSGYGKFDRLYGVDRYADHHDLKEYLHAANGVGMHPNYALLRMTFSEAASLFPDKHFDFVYIDGYAHTGQDSGKTLEEWYPKVRTGGIFAGHDYHPKWPLTMKAVDGFMAARGLTFSTTTDDEYPSWYTRKTD